MTTPGHEILQLSYVRIGVSSLTWWRRFAETAGFGLSEDAPAGELWLRTDYQRDYRIVLHESGHTGLDTLGWEVADAPALAALRLRLQDLGVETASASADLTLARRVQELLVARDPDGVRNEIGWGAGCALRRMIPVGTAATFHDGSLGFGHATMSVADAAATLRFYTQGMGLRLSDAAWMERHSRVYFLRCNPRHHSYAFAEMFGRPPGAAHVMADVLHLDALGEIRDRLLDGEFVLNRDLGSHPLDGVVSIYVATPDGFDIELACGTRVLDEATWDTDKFTRTGRPWGHRRPLPTKNRL
jgi:3,4-dihydroxy-9,10-secoandrosta-1,3,5(10)-triene-9,17-dione 4,5-dioxygenase